MNASQLHERLRVEIVRRIDRGMLTGTLLAKQTGLQASHISNFLHRKRQLSLAAIDRVLAAQSLGIEDFLPMKRQSGQKAPAPTERDLPISVPVVSGTTAIHSPSIPSSAIIDTVYLSQGLLAALRSRRAIGRRDWSRFLALRITLEQAAPMHPVLRPHSVVVIDRHYNSFAPYRPPMPNLYAVNMGGSVSFRYASFDTDSLILRPYSLDYAVELLRLNNEESPSEYLVGRVCMTLVEQ